MTPVRTVARALLSAVFIRGGLSAYNNPDRLVDGAKPVTDRLAPALEAVGLPTDTRTLVRINGAVQVAGGVLLATNTFARPAALALAGSLVPTTLAGHDFWSRENPTERVGHQIHFLKNVGLLGGLLLAAVDTEAKPGLVWRTGHLAEHASDSVRRAAKDARRAAGTTTRETRRAGRLATKEARRAVGTTTRETRRAARLAASEARRAAQDARRTARAVLPL
jgi:uncharacterized membrane protein YphA (DoxX/SURF4 family)